MKSNWECTGRTVSDSRQEVVLKLRVWRVASNSCTQNITTLWNFTEDLGASGFQRGNDAAIVTGINKLK
jgi:hypothetical protein